MNDGEEAGDDLEVRIALGRHNLANDGGAGVPAASSSMAVNVSGVPGAACGEQGPGRGAL
jgi:hypothetical protein